MNTPGRISYTNSSSGGEREFERVWGGDIQGYCSVLIGKQIPSGCKTTASGGKCPPP